MDPEFGDDGVARHDFAVATDLLQAAARAPDGRVYFGGYTMRDGGANMAVLRWTPKGPLSRRLGTRDCSATT